MSYDALEKCVTGVCRVAVFKQSPAYVRHVSGGAIRYAMADHTDLSPFQRHVVFHISGSELKVSDILPSRSSR